MKCKVCNKAEARKNLRNSAAKLYEVCYSRECELTAKMLYERRLVYHAQRVIGFERIGGVWGTFIDGRMVKRRAFVFNFRAKRNRKKVIETLHQIIAKEALLSKIKDIGAIKHVLDTRFCNQQQLTIKQFSYEGQKRISDTLRNYGRINPLLSGLTPARSKPSKYAKHH